MNKFVLCFFFALLILFCATLTAGKILTFAAAEESAKEIKQEFNKTKDETKEAIVRDVKAIKEQTPKDLEKAKTEFIKKKNEVKTGAAQELKEIREGLKKPIKPATTEQKK